MKKLLLFVSFVLLTILSFGQKKQSISWDFDHKPNGLFNITQKNKKDYNHVKQNVWFNPEKGFTLETKVRQNSGTFDNGYGILWGYYRNEEYNEFIISADGYFAVSQIKQRAVVDIVKWKRPKDTTLIKPTSQWNTLKIVQNETETVYYINNVEVHRGDRPEVAGTDVGLCAYNIQNVDFDYFKFDYWDEEINVPEELKTSVKPKNVGPNINSPGEENNPVISADGKTMFFARIDSNNLFNSKRSEIYRSELQKDGTWGKAINLGAPINNAGTNFPIAISPDKNELYVSYIWSEDGTKFMGEGISKSTLIDGKWSIPKKVNIPNVVNKSKFSSLGFAPDGKHAFVCVSNEESFGNSDLFISFKDENGNWSSLKNIGLSINTFHSDFGPFIAGDNTTMFFSSYGHRGYGSADIFMSKRLDDTWLNWSKPINIGPITNDKNWNAYFVSSAVGDYGYMIAYDKDNTFGDQDIYRVELPEILKPVPTTIVSGKVYDAETKKPIQAKIIYEDLETGAELGVALSTVDNGFKITLPSGKKYGFLAKADKYASISSNLDLSNLKSYNEKEVNLEIAPIKKGQTVRINNLFFDLGKYNLRKESFSELNRLVKLLKTNSEISIDVIGHTDNQGDDGSNMTLSKNRAKSVVDYLIKNGINASRINAVGKGESKPVASNKTEEGRQKNRRVEFLIK